MKHNEELSVMKQRVCQKMMTLKSNGQEEKYPVSLIDMNCWEWPQGVGLYGLYKDYENTGDPRLLEFLCQWYDARLEEGIHEKNVNTTAPMLTLTYLYEKTKKKRYLDTIREWTDWIMDEQNGLIRVGDGCFQHMITGDPNKGEILIDTLFMAVLFLDRAGTILERTDCLEEASYQILNHIKYLWNRYEGLFYHGWNFDGMHNYGRVMWGRGNSWYTLGIMEYLETFHGSSSMRRYFLSVFCSQAETLRKCQDPSGLWHTVLNRPDTYLEASATAAFLAGIMKGVRLGVLEAKPFLPVIERGIEGMCSLIDPDGAVRQVSYGTPIGKNEEFYNQIPCCTMTYGQALTILMLQEAEQSFWTDRIFGRNDKTVEA